MTTQSVVDTDSTWKSGPRERVRQASSMRTHPQLFVVLECDRIQAGGARYDLSEVDEVLIGRGPERLGRAITAGSCRKFEVRLPGKYLSGRHARLKNRGLDYYIEDLGSTNGTYVNGEKVTSARLLQEGDCIEVGHVLLTLQTNAPTPDGTETSLDASQLIPVARGFLTLDPTLAHAYSETAKVARSGLPIVLVGSTGTGKEVVARAIHEISGRTGPFVAVNCGALTANLAESQLFGHSRGAFSGAVREELGFVRSAHQGTLFLDEVSELPHASQVALLRVLQESEVNPVGCASTTKVDLRVIAACQESLAGLVERQRFRADLRARLEGYCLTLPPLRERRVDLGVLLSNLSERASPLPIKLLPEVARRLWDYDWPLNIREVEQVVRRASVLSGNQCITLDHLGALAGEANTASSDVRSLCGSAPTPRLSACDLALRDQLVSLLAIHGGNISKVARSIGKARSQVQRWLHRLAIRAKDYR